MPLLDPFFAEILRCSCPHRADIVEREAEAQLECAKCHLRFQVRDEIPNMILEDAIVTDDFLSKECGATEIVCANQP